MNLPDNHGLDEILAGPRAAAEVLANVGLAAEGVAIASLVAILVDTPSVRRSRVVALTILGLQADAILALRN